MILGIDTSNYTTSLAAVENGQIMFDGRKLLTVEAGDRGLSQSEALFQHIKNLPGLFGELGPVNNIEAVCVSSRPRRLPDSYMPCFLAGITAASAVAETAGAVLIKAAHQEGHIQSGFIGREAPHAGESFLAVHASGGTTEILLCARDSGGFSAEIIGGTADISAGQFIDRCGVAIGLGFPCGKAMDALYTRDADALKLPLSVKGSRIFFAGGETRVRQLIDSGAEKNSIVRAVFDNIAASLAAAVICAVKESGIKKVLFTGGVSASVNIGAAVGEKLDGVCEVRFAERRYCTDNAVGTALLGERICHG